MIAPPLRGILQSKRPRPKRVRFGASPADTPSKLRSISQAVTESYTGHDMDPHADSPGVLAFPAQVPASSLRAARTDADSYQPVVPNLTGTFTLDYTCLPASSSAPGPGTVAGTVGEPAPSSNVLRASEPTSSSPGCECLCDFAPQLESGGGLGVGRPIWLQEPPERASRAVGITTIFFYLLLTNLAGSKPTRSIELGTSRNTLT
ncbi:hypothetical protein Egran_06899 [Elaphomyces granulatus]|uniref:Uncharacterized protein n=1 Tax=Elaphomyces granulatus TaxID=519963 RepID=A0A232LMF0_9EURO|nr:hypothetical protein Egran_06899 [Elaphomyces granulatus]